MGIMETYTTLNGFDIAYEISTHGNIRKPSGYILKPFKCHKGMYVSLHSNSRIYKRLLSALVLDAFKGGYAKNRKVKHLDGNRTNCYLNNLRWRYGWTGIIDTEIEVSNVNDKTILNYLKSSDMRYIYALIKSNSGIVWRVCKDCKKSLLYEDVKSELLFILKGIFDGGRYKPNQDNFTTLITKIIRYYIRDMKQEVEIQYEGEWLI